MISFNIQGITILFSVNANNIDQKNKVKKFHLEATLKKDYMISQGFSPKQLEQPGLVMENKIEPIRSDIKEIKIV